MSRTHWIATLASLALLSGAAFALWMSTQVASSAATKPVSSKPPLVTVLRARLVDVPVRLAVQGHLVALNQVDVRPQVNGSVRAVHFREGDDVTAGQLLFTLDASDAGVQLDRANAQVAQLTAQLGDAQRELARARQLAQDNFISPSAVEAAAGKLAALEAQHRAGLADVASARVAVERTRITAPISARSGQLSVHPGSLAQTASASPLVTLLQFDPIGVAFTVPEADLRRILQATQSLKDVRAVAPQLDLGNGTHVAGTLVFVNNLADTATGTVDLKASFPNAQRSLWPGGFARLEMDAGTDQGVALLPPQAVQNGPSGAFVYLLDAADRVALRPVSLLRVQDDRAVVRGLADGDRIVVEGARNLREGVQAQVGTVSAPGLPS